MPTAIKFQDVEIVKSPVIFKKINVEDFEAFGYQARISKIIPTEEGYISEQVKAQLDYTEKNTVVLNAGVGQGKTHTILDIAKWYYDTGYIVIFAVPYKSLIDQYFGDLTGEERNILPDEIVDYRKISENPNEANIADPIIPLNASLRPIHLITVNCLLGNPGEDFIMQSEAKLHYLDFLIERCKVENKKVVLIFDEIHDSFHLFKERFIFHLYKWGNLLNKIYCISATYNEASKTAIKYLALTTDKKIQIIESSRDKFEFKQSELFILLYNKYHYKADDDDLVSIFKHLISLDKKINVLSYSKTLAEEIAKPEGEIGKLLNEKFGEINLCVGNSDVIFDPRKCNIGTTFTTGINIRGNDSAFVVILPSKLAYEQKRLGVFSRGINTLIQSLARIRDKSEIYIITPSPDYLINYPTQDGDNYVTKLLNTDFFFGLESKDKYYDINNQRELINEFYLKLRENAGEGIAIGESLIEGTNSHLSQQFPSLDDYILNDGEKVLYKTYDICGKDFSIYTFWAAFNDQFINCRLKGYVVLNELVFKDGEIMRGLRQFAYEKLFDYTSVQTIEDKSLQKHYISEYFQLKSDKECYQTFKNILFNNSIYVIKNNIKNQIFIRRNPSFLRNVIAIVQLIKKDNEYYKKKYYSAYEKYGSSLGELVDTDYEAKDYLFACFINSERTDFSSDITPEETELLKSYGVLYQFFKSFKERFVLQDANGVKYFESTYEQDIISDEEFSKLKQAILIIQQNDEVIKLKIVSFLQSITAITSNTSILNSIVRFYKNTFFTTVIRRVVINTSENRRDVIDAEFSPPKEQLINLLFTPEFYWLEDNHGIDGTVIDITYSPNHPDLDI